MARAPKSPNAGRGGPRRPGVTLRAPTPSEDEILALEERLRHAQCDRILACLLAGTDQAFEHAILKLFLAMEAFGKHGRVTGRTKDRGIDAELSTDRAHVEVTLCLQAKCWNRPVGGPTVREFAGALRQRGVERGVLVTTSRFTREAELAAPTNKPRVTLIPGKELAQLMHHYDLGVRPRMKMEIKTLDLESLSIRERTWLRVAKISSDSVPNETAKNALRNS